MITRNIIALSVFVATFTIATEQDDQFEENDALISQHMAIDFAKVQSQSNTNDTSEVTQWGSLTLLDANVGAGESATLPWYSGHLPGGFRMPTPVVVLRGKQPGPTVCLTAAIHGDEINGVEIARRVVQNLNAEEIKGTIISVPVVNMDGLWRKDRYMADRRDLNRAFPGEIDGTTASRVAYSLFTEIIRHCDSLVDLHSGSMFRENSPQLRADLTIEDVADIAKQFGAISVLQSIAPVGSLRGAATAAGIPTVVMEVGGPYTVDLALVETAVKALRSYLSAIEMLPRSFFWSSPQPVFYASQWVRSRDGGILINKVKLGQQVNKGQLLATISNPITDQEESIVAPFNAVVLGRAQDQFVSAGYAVFNLGERRSIEDLEQQGQELKAKAVVKNVEQLGLNTELIEEQTKSTSSSIATDATKSTN
ncbi:succinylglutamate desuccinylase [Alginatibacterium sediminis]|uniref:Succinylglutamate desuccinylase n=1 Tax=Alginatibacterium sediminis TaxID=2164068 RepID=A0A420EH75_9ALTE|nr:succinylglutamate desuccinylase/aspartoacylase family protein [Alginatibacterium sediminis]RKF20014.1 succinylglutamate desuccinylase [Alginatibacterium sediminis]